MGSEDFPRVLIDTEQSGIRDAHPTRSGTGRSRTTLISAAIGGTALLLAVIAMFFQKTEGTLRVEIFDPQIELSVKGTQFVVKGAKKEDMQLPPGDYVLHVKRGGLEFDSKSLRLKKGETVLATAEVLEGKVQVASNGSVLGSKTLSVSSTVKQTSSVHPPVTPGQRQGSSWDDLQPFIAKLNEGNSARDLTFALPTEAQWEYACRAGTTSDWYSGDHREDVLQYGWIDQNAEGVTHPVGESLPNAFGVYDLHGNLWEWCADWFESGYSPSAVDDPRGPLSGSERVFRGGCWGGSVRNCRSAYRSWRPPEDREFGLGCRLTMTIESTH